MMCLLRSRYESMLISKGSSMSVLRICGQNSLILYLTSLPISGIINLDKLSIVFLLIKLALAD